MSAAKLTIGQKVDDEASALAFADELLANAATYFSSSDNDNNNNDNQTKTSIEWTTVAQVNGVEIQTASVQNRPKVQLQRAVIPVGGGNSSISGISASQQLYEFLISKEGYIFLDPDANPDNFNQPLLGPFEWNTTTTREGGGRDGDGSSTTTGGKAQVEYASLTLPCPFTTRDFIILNAVDGASKTFLSTSCYSSQLLIPGKSPYDYEHDSDHSMTTTPTAVSSADGNIRMAISGIYTVTEKDGQVLLEVAQFIDLNGWTSTAFNNFANTTWFKAFIPRAQTKFPTKKE